MTGIKKYMTVDEYYTRENPTSTQWMVSHTVMPTNGQITRPPTRVKIGWSKDADRQLFHLRASIPVTDVKNLSFARSFAYNSTYGLSLSFIFTIELKALTKFYYSRLDAGVAKDSLLGVRHTSSSALRCELYATKILHHWDQAIQEFLVCSKPIKTLWDRS